MTLACPIEGAAAAMTSEAEPPIAPANAPAVTAELKFAPMA